MENYPQTPEITVTRAALDASTEAARQVIVLIAENARLRSACELAWSMLNVSINGAERALTQDEIAMLCSARDQVRAAITKGPRRLTR